MDLIKEKIKSGIAEILKEKYQLEDQSIDLQETKKEFEGDFTFVVFPLTKVLRMPPPKIAQELGEELTRGLSLIEKFQVVQGFLNLSIEKGEILQNFNQLIQKEHFHLASKNRKVLVEYSSPNTNKPLHLGHLRNNFLGYSVSKIMEAAGYTVVKTNLVNDRGIHICKSMLAYELFGNQETPASSGIKGDHLVGKYYVLFDQHYKKEIEELVSGGMDQEMAKKEAPLLKKAQEMLLAWEQGDEAVVDLWRRMNEWVFAGFEQSYEQMGVEFDRIYKESNTYLLGKELVEEGLKMGVFFQKADGSVWINLEEEGLDEKLVLRKDGTSVYITQDMGTAKLKYEDYGMDRSIYVVGNEQDYHFEVLFSILKKLNKPYSTGNYHLSYGMVDLPSGKMKSREGTVVDADDLMQEMIETAKERTLELGKIDGFSEEESNALFKNLGLGALKYFLLKVDPKKRMLFDPNESIDFQGNTGPFIQYTHARICSIERKMLEQGIHLGPIELNLEIAEIEKELILVLGKYTNILEEAAREYSPSTIAQYIYDLAKLFNRFYYELSILGEDNTEIKNCRLNLAVQTRKTIDHGCSLLGITAPTRM